MAENAGNLAQWGVAGALGDSGAVTGVVTSISWGEEAQTAPQYDEKGAVRQVTHYDTHKTMNATVEVAADTAAPAPGTAISIGGVSGYVVSAEVVEDNQAYRKINIRAEAWASVTTVTAATSGTATDNNSNPGTN